MEERAHAKVNLSLRVLARREDGFHEIETLMTPINLYDTLRFAPAAEFAFHCSQPSLPTNADNLVVRAAELFFAETQREAKVAISLEKRIPHGAGLGGGSSDAAATLRGLNRFLAASLSQDKLQELAARLGSDVPFFLQERPAICRGRGEKIEPARLETSLRLLLLKPSFAVSTAWAYAHWQNSRAWKAMSYQPQVYQGQGFENDLERPVFEKYLFLAQIKEWLRKQSEIAAALLTGSGSTVFGVLHDQANADSLIPRARAELDSELFGALCETF